MGVTSSSILDARVALRLANSSWVVIRPRFRRGAGIGMGAASGVATWEGIVVDVVDVMGGVVVGGLGLVNTGGRGQGEQRGGLPLGEAGD
jgi:hypothetical protein